VVGGDADPSQHTISLGLRRRLSFGQKRIVRRRGEDLAYANERRQVRLALARRVIPVSALAQSGAAGNLGIREPQLSRSLAYPFGKNRHGTFCSCARDLSQEGFVLYI